MEKIRLTITVRYSMLIGGQTSSSLADINTAREEGGAPIIPASALKGALRIEFERLAAGLGKQICHLNRPEDACKPNSPCLACQLFGSPGREGKLRFQDARLKGDLRKLFTKEDRPQVEPAKPTGKGYAVRPGVAINRIRKIAEENMLFTSETVAPYQMAIYGSSSPLVFSSEVEVTGTLNPEEFKLLQAAVLSLQSVGAGKSRGLGHLEAKIERADGTSNNKISQPKFGND
ncbi:MAG: RAMP superfamily CRISPR-associated protein, partial [Candidatus Bathyarchaeia archaeon]